MATGFLDFVRGLAKRDAPPTSVELRKALAEAEAAAGHASAECAQLAVERADALLNGTDAALDRIERALQLAQRAADRSDTAAAALRERITVAETAERLAALDRTYAEGEAAYRRAVSIIAEEYPVHATSIAALMAELVDLYATIRSVNEALDRAQDGRAINDPDLSARPRPVHSFLPFGFVDSVKLPATESAERMIWPASVDANGFPDLKPRPSR